MRPILWRVSGGLLVVLVAAAVTAAGCGPDRLTNQDFCDEAAIGVAQRSFDCAESTDVANAAHDDVARLSCLGGGDEATNLTEIALYQCTEALLAVDCAVVNAHPREPVQYWLPPTCGTLLAGVPGAAGAAGSTGGSP